MAVFGLLEMSVGGVIPFRLTEAGAVELVWSVGLAVLLGWSAGTDMMILLSTLDDVKLVSLLSEGIVFICN